MICKVHENPGVMKDLISAPGVRCLDVQTKNIECNTYSNEIKKPKDFQVREGQACVVPLELQNTLKKINH